MAETALAGRRVFVVEDEWLIQVLIEDALGELGCSVSDTAARLDEALAKAATVACDVAVLEVNLNDQSTYSVAAALQARGVPFVFATGYDAAGLGADYPHVPVVHKPFGTRELAQALATALTGPPAS
jgi:CheY-like chemotaxis protein